MLLANQPVDKTVVPFANRILPTAVASLLAKVTAAELTASPLRLRYTWLLAKLSQQDSRSCWRRALFYHLKRQRFFPNRVGVFANCLALLAYQPLLHHARGQGRTAHGCRLDQPFRS
jgi:hypothetical protein